jgi:ABC-type transporter MlaC component
VRASIALLGLLVLSAAGPWGASAGEVRPDGREGTPRAAIEQLNTQLRAAMASGGKPLETAAAGLLDTGEIARRALGRHHRDRTAGERAEFAGLMAAHFVEWYAGVLGRNPRLQLEATSIDGAWAVVRASVARPGRDLEMAYRLHRGAGDRWLLYDLETNGRSRLHSLYGEFDRVILNEGYRELVDRVRADLAARRDRARSADRPHLTDPTALPAGAPDRTHADQAVTRPRR